MNVYQNLGINTLEQANLPAGTVASPYVIRTVQLMKKAYEGKDILRMSFREEGNKLGRQLGYGLVGEDVFKPFMNEMKVNEVDGLEGKVVLAFIPPSNDKITGLTTKP